MTLGTFTPLKGRCACGTVTYQVLAPFIYVQCCHCTQCQNDTGSAFALNAVIETSNFRITSSSQPSHTETIKPSGKIGILARCPICYTAIYGDYDGDGSVMTFVKAGTLDEESKQSAKPTGHIFTSTKLDWVDLTSERERGVPVAQERYSRREVWSIEANARYDALLVKEEAAKKVKATRQASST